MPPKRDVSANNFLRIVEANSNSSTMSDADFRQFIRNTLPIVQYESLSDWKTREESQKREDRARGEQLRRDNEENDHAT